MTREEAIEWLDWVKMDMRQRGYNDIIAALSMAIQALEQGPCEDCINRDSAIKALDYDIKHFEFKSGVSKYMDGIAKLLNTIYETQVDNIKVLPSVTPQEPTRIHAKWKYADAYNYRCSKCKHVSPWDYAYCPYCGAQMDLEGEDGSNNN